jgi:hypothetical protein
VRLDEPTSRAATAGWPAQALPQLPQVVFDKNVEGVPVHCTRGETGV